MVTKKTSTNEKEPTAVLYCTALMRNIGLALVAQVGTVLSLTALCVFARGEHTDLELVTNGAMHLQLICYWLISVGAMMVHFVDLSSD